MNRVRAMLIGAHRAASPALDVCIQVAGVEADVPSETYDCDLLLAHEATDKSAQRWSDNRLRPPRRAADGGQWSYS